VETLLAIGLWNAVGAAVLAVVAACVGCLSRRPAVRHALWLLVLVKLVTPPLWPVTVPWSPTEPPAVPVTQPLPVEVFLEPVVPDAIVLAPEPLIEPAPVQSWPVVETIVTAWLAGAFLCWAINIVSICRFRHVVKRLRPAPEALQERAARLANRLGLRRAPLVCLVAGPVSPMVWTMFGRARLLLPDLLWERLSEERRDLVITHELAHLRRRDHCVRMGELFVVGLYWWFPVAWWARRQVETAAELCCDAYVVALFPEAAADYAATLVDSVSYLSPNCPLPAGAVGFGAVSSLRRRISMILNGKMPERLSRSGLVLLLTAAAVVLPLWPAEPAAPQPEEMKPPERKSEEPAAPQPVEPQVAGGEKTDAVRDLEIARFWEKEGRPGSAMFYYQIIKRRYPGTPEAEVAEKRIAELRDAARLAADTKKRLEPSQAVPMAPPPGAVASKDIAVDQAIPVEALPPPPRALEPAGPRRLGDIAVDHIAHNFGVVKLGTKLKHQFTLTNVSEKAELGPFRISSPWPMIPRMKSGVLAPGESRVLTMEIDTTGKEIPNGTREFVVYLGLEQPNGGVPSNYLQLTLTADFRDSRSWPGPAPVRPAQAAAVPVPLPAPVSDQERVQQLESKLELLFNELDAVRSELKNVKSKSPPVKPMEPMPLAPPPPVPSPAKGVALGQFGKIRVGHPVEKTFEVFVPAPQRFKRLDGLDRELLLVEIASKSDADGEWLALKLNYAPLEAMGPVTRYLTVVCTDGESRVIPVSANIVK
jgi:beta-lactamase regulating signal transducer with metallopeptidase domain